MKECIICTNKFSLSQKIIAFHRRYGEIECKHCKAKYRRQENFKQEIYFSALFIIFSIIIIFNTENILVGGFLGGVFGYISFIISNLVVLKSIEYKIYNQEREF